MPRIRGSGGRIPTRIRDLGYIETKNILVEIATWRASRIATPRLVASSFNSKSMSSCLPQPANPRSQAGDKVNSDRHGDISRSGRSGVRQ